MRCHSTNFENELSISAKHFLLALTLFILVMNAAIFTEQLVDWDEIVYLHLSEHMGWFLDDYTLRGSFIEKNLSQKVYSAPVFYHPPLIPYLIKIVSTVLSPILSAKLINFILILLSYFLIFRITSMLSDYRGALIALSLWAVCPIFNLESHLIHLDFPLAVFILMGIWLFLEYERNDGKTRYLCLSALAFVLAMLTKYTGPIYVLIPFGLMVSSDWPSVNKKHAVIFCLILLAGFLWWGYVFWTYGSLMPAEFMGHQAGKMFSSPYLRSILERNWYDVWFYFAAICPLFFVYLGGGMNYIVSRFQKLLPSKSNRQSLAILAAINISMIISTVLFSIINAHSNGYWTMRHMFPIYPVIYVTIGAAMSYMFSRRDKIMNAYLFVYVFLNLVCMSSSMVITVLNRAGLKAIPVLYLWIPGLREYFH